MSDAQETFDGSPAGIQRAGRDGTILIDALAGRSSALGFGNASVVQSIQLASQEYLGDPIELGRPSENTDENEEGLLAEAVLAVIDGHQHVAADNFVLCESADAAVETAIRFARSWKPDAFRTIALIGSDHGRTAACRTASGRPELHEGYGPMMAGFAHVPAGDIAALEATIDDQTACVLISPIDLHDAARALSPDYLHAVQKLCDEHQVALVIDETRLCIGGSGAPFYFAALSDIKADAVILSAGLFGGLSGGLFIGSQRLVSGVSQADRTPVADLPMQKAIALATLAEMQNAGLPIAIADATQELAVMLAEQVGGFEFVRDLHASGMTIGIETDISASEIVVAAAKSGLRIESAGDTAVRLQLPLVLPQVDRDALMSRLGSALQHIEHESIDAVENPQ
jgi:acetylornithine/succinyldiaminopimelate/putrescine aminotransferase